MAALSIKLVIRIKEESNSEFNTYILSSDINDGFWEHDKKLSKILDIKDPETDEYGNLIDFENYSIIGHILNSELFDKDDNPIKALDYFRMHQFNFHEILDDENMIKKMGILSEKK